LTHVNEKRFVVLFHNKKKTLFSQQAETIVSDHFLCALQKLSYKIFRTIIFVVVNF